MQRGHAVFLRKKRHFFEGDCASMEIDATDRRILAVLQKQGRVTNAELAERVNLSPSACHRRVQRLEAEGYIAGVVALLNARQLCRPTAGLVEITLPGQADGLPDVLGRAVAPGAGTL